MPSKELFIEIYTEETPIQMQKNILETWYSAIEVE